MTATLPYSVQRQNSGHLLARIFETPDLARIVPRLSPAVLNRIIQSCGLEDCGALVSMATPAQLAAVFDLDLWRSPRPGVDEQLDAERFSVWIEVLLDSGDVTAADTIAAVEPGLVVAALSEYVSVVDRAALTSPPRSDDEEDAVDAFSAPARCSDISGYRVTARRHDAWDPIVALLRTLSTHHRDYFDRVMTACRRLSNAPREVDGLDQLMTETEQFIFNCGVEREGRRERQGYVTPPQAAAFLRMSRTMARGPDSARPPGNPIARAYFRAMDWIDDGLIEAPSPSADAAVGVARIVGLLVDAGVLPEGPKALLEGAEGPRPHLALIRSHLEFVRQHDDAAYLLRSQELGYLANVLLAGCVVHSRAFTAAEALEAACAVCNLGLDSWPRHWTAQRAAGGAADRGSAPAAGLLLEQDLVGVFQVGWATLHQDVCMFAAARLIDVLRPLRFDDRDVQAGVKALVKDLAAQSAAGVPWRAHQSFDVIAILDQPAWAAVLGFIHECPTIHGAVAAATQSRVLSVSSTAFEFIAERSQVERVHDYMASLAGQLRQ